MTMLKNTHIWLGSYLEQRLIHFIKGRRCDNLKHVIFCLVDHFEPDWNHADEATQQKRVDLWIEKYPQLASEHRDSDGRHPQHTFFYPAEVYHPEHLEKLANLCRQGHGEIEVHLHHDNDNAQGLRDKLEKAKSNFLKHHVLGFDKITQETRFGFIHGNWALNNSRRDGRWCGVNEETTILKNAGCYADFTLPSAPSDTQTQKINSLYYDVTNGNKIPKSHNHGKDSIRGETLGDALLIVQGPLALNWHDRKWGVIPRIENGELHYRNSPRPSRIDLWVQLNISVRLKEDWVFVKIHTHGAPEQNAAMLLNSGLENMWTYLETRYNDGQHYQLHYVSAREMVNIIHAAEAGENGNPGLYRDYVVLSYLR